MTLRHPSLARSWRRTLACTALLVVCTCARAQNCSFDSAGSALNFPPLDAYSAVTVSAFMDVVVKCTPTSVSPIWSFAGANGSTPLRMKHTTQNIFIPYSITTTFLGASGSKETWRINGTILGANYQNAAIGTYTDILVATVTP